MTKKNITIAGLVVAAAALTYEVTNSTSPKKAAIEKTAHIGIAIGLGLVLLAIIKKD